MFFKIISRLSFVWKTLLCLGKLIYDFQVHMECAIISVQVLLRQKHVKKDFRPGSYTAVNQAASLCVFFCLFCEALLLKVS